MADIRSYIKEKEKREQNQASYKDKIRRHKLTSLYRVLLVAAAIAALIVLIVVQYKRHVYTDYDTVFSVPRESAGDSTNIRLGNSILTYSKDGAHCTDARGNTTWNQTFEIQDIKVVTSGSTSAIAGYNARSIYVQDTAKQYGVITTTMPIRDIAVSSTGRVTAVLADTDLTWVNTYDINSENYYSGQTHMNDSGYPTAISLSPNGELLGAAYAYVDAGVLKTNVVFYNFGPVGTNNSDFIVSTNSYTDMLVPMLRFMNDDTAFAVGDSRLMIYSGSQKPVSKAEYLYDQEVRSVFYSDKYVGLVFQSEKEEKKYRMDVYDTSAEKRGSYYFDTDYTDIFFGQDNFVIYNDTECVIMTLSGIEKFNSSFTKTVRLMLPTESAYRYVLVTDTSIDTIQLK